MDERMKGFSMVGRVGAPGVVNSLQVLTVDKGFVEDASSWMRRDSGVQSQFEGGREGEGGLLIHNKKAAALGVKSFCVVVGVGQEPKLGRWFKVKEGGARNEALVFLFKPWTTTSSSVVD